MNEATIAAIYKKAGHARCKDDACGRPIIPKGGLSLLDKVLKDLIAKRYVPKRGPVVGVAIGRVGSFLKGWPTLAVRFADNTYCTFEPGEGASEGKWFRTPYSSRHMLSKSSIEGEYHPGKPL